MAVKVPSDWKKGNTIPSYPFLKRVEGRPWELLTTVPSKIMEQILLKAMSRDRDDKEALRDRQHGLPKSNWA